MCDHAEDSSPSDQQRSDVERQTALHLLSVPDRSGFHAALGHLAIAHAHFELILRYAVKTLAGLPPSDGLAATRGSRMADVMERVKKLFKEKHATAQEQTELDALLGKLRTLSKKRNTYLHSALSQTPAGEVIQKTEDDRWGPAPTTEDVERVANDILILSQKLNDARLRGLIYKVVKRHKLASGAANLPSENDGR